MFINIRSMLDRFKAGLISEAQLALALDCYVFVRMA